MARLHAGYAWSVLSRRQERLYVAALLALDALALGLVLTGTMGWALLIPAAAWTLALAVAMVWRARVLRGPTWAERQPGNPSK